MALARNTGTGTKKSFWKAGASHGSGVPTRLLRKQDKRRRVSSACLRFTSAPTWSRWRPKASRPNEEREHWRLSRPTPRSSTYSTLGRQSTVSAIMRLRQARNAEQLAAEIEPLALSLATLAAETRQTLAEQQQASREQAATWSLHQQQAAETLKGAASSIEKSAQQLRKQSEAATQASRGLTWRLFLAAILSGTLAAGATSAFWLWLSPPEVKNTVMLDAQGVAEVLKPAIEDALRKRR